MWVFWSHFQIVQTAAVALVVTEVLQVGRFHMSEFTVDQEKVLGRDKIIVDCEASMSSLIIDRRMSDSVR